MKISIGAITRHISAFLITQFAVFSSYAPPGGSWNPGDTDPTVPLGRGTIFLIVLALVYGLIMYFIRSRKRI